MKSLLKAFVLIAVLAVMTGCMGAPGDPGKAYISFSKPSDALTLSFTGDLYNVLPDPAYLNTYYEIDAGDYSGIYILEDAFSNPSNNNYLITVTVNEGKPGKLFWVKGDNGEDAYFDLYCGWSGMEVSQSSMISPAGKENNIGKSITNTITKGNYTLKVITGQTALKVNEVIKTLIEIKKK